MGMSAPYFVGYQRVSLRLAALIIALCMVTACATVTELQKQVEQKAPCCKSLAELPFEPLAAGTSSSFRLDSQSPVFAFASGKSYFKAFSFEAPAAGKMLNVMSNPTGSIAFESMKYAQSFCPSIKFLNAQYVEVTTAEDRDQVYDVPRWVTNFWSSYFLSTFRVPADAKHVVLYTSPESFHRHAVIYSSGGGYLVGKTFVFQGAETIGYPCGPVANARVELI